eukprot:TRINITY_DN8508_c0_g1_i1.p1 TRINITY_DN8508_c0_g1~~TRINITY_DN8508_c0_g1_i1.p1  ORF type:complete len:519 (-),score=27.18 TRINITY_DN8508_c0_g1_i1:41-1597(-)
MQYFYLFEEKEEKILDYIGLSRFTTFQKNFILTVVNLGAFLIFKDAIPNKLLAIVMGDYSSHASASALFAFAIFLSGLTLLPVSFGIAGAGTGKVEDKRRAKLNRWLQIANIALTLIPLCYILIQNIDVSSPLTSLMVTESLGSSWEIMVQNSVKLKVAIGLLLLLNIIFGLPVATSKFVKWKMLLALVNGLLSGFIFLEILLPGMALALNWKNTLFYGAFLTISVLKIEFLVFIQWPNFKILKFMKYMFAVILILNIVVFEFANLVLLTGTIANLKSGVVKNIKNFVLSISICYYILLALLIKFKISGNVKKAATTTGTTTPLKSYNSTLAGADLPLMGNISAILGFCLSIFLNMYFLSGSNMCVVFLSPILLLLNNDKKIVSNLNDDNRYYPLVLVVSWFLMATCLFEELVWGWVWLSSAGEGAITFGYAPSIWSVMWNLLCFVVTVPEQILLQRWLKDPTGRKGGLPMFLVPIQLLPILFSRNWGLTTLGMLATIGSFVQFFISRKTQRTGLRRV